MSPRYRPLTEREQEVLVLLGLGFATGEIARELDISVETAGVLVDRVTGYLAQRRRGERGEPLRLTRRQQEVLALVREGLKDREIADRLGIGLRTAEDHVRRVLRQMDKRSRREL